MTGDAPSDEVIERWARSRIRPSVPQAAPQPPASPGWHFCAQLLCLLAALPALAGLYAISSKLVIGAGVVYFLLLLIEKQGVGPDDEANSAVSLFWVLLLWLFLPIAAVVKWIA